MRWVSIRAAGYDLDGSNAVTLKTGTTTANVHLKKTAYLAEQLSNGDWLASIPGTPAEKRAAHRLQSRLPHIISGSDDAL